jgi:hypothetical protein
MPLRTKAASALIIWAVIALWAISAWLTHVIVTIQNEQWTLLIAGAIMAPVGVVHGTGLWFGAW